MTTPDTTMTPHQAMRALLEQHGVTMTTARLPLSAPDDPLRFRWSVAFSKGGREFLASKYHAGIGHAKLPEGKGYKGPRMPRTMYDQDFDDAVEYAVRSGKAVKLSLLMFGPTVDIWPDPDPVNVLSCLLLDGGAIDHPTYESWADEYGHDRDSRSGERTYRECLETGLKLRVALGEDLLRTLRDLASEL